jgi:hypothetical protein
LEIPGPDFNHESPPKPSIRELWVKDGGLGPLKKKRIVHPSLIASVPSIAWLHDRRQLVLDLL